MIRSSAATITAAVLLLGAGCDSPPEEDGGAPGPAPAASTDTAPEVESHEVVVVLEPGVDPARFAEERGLEPEHETTVGEERAIVLSVTDREREVLAADSLIQDVLRSVEETRRTAASDTQAGERRQSYFVHLRPGTDLRAFAARYGLTPANVITEPRPGMVVSLTEAERKMLAADSLVRSLARQIHGGDDTTGPPIQSLGGDSTGG